MLGKSKSHNDKSQDNLEYNDGLGDLLKEKEQFEFSWVKTIASVVLIILILYICITALFKIAKSIVKSPEVEIETTTPERQNPVALPTVATPSETVNVTPTPAVTQQPRVTNQSQSSQQDVKPVSPAPSKPEPKLMPKSETKSAYKPEQKQAPKLEPKPDMKPEQRSVKSGPVKQPVSEKKVNDVPAKSEPLQHKASFPNVQNTTRSTRSTEHQVQESSSKHRGSSAKKIPASTSETNPVENSGAVYRVFAGSFVSRKNADVLRAQLAKKGVESYISVLTSDQNESVYRVQVGLFKSIDVARKLQMDLNRKGVETYIHTSQ